MDCSASLFDGLFYVFTISIILLHFPTGGAYPVVYLVELKERERKMFGGRRGRPGA